MTKQLVARLSMFAALVAGVVPSVALDSEATAQGRGPGAGGGIGGGSQRDEARAMSLDEVIAAERAFARAASEDGRWAAFVAYLAADAIVFRPGPVNAQEWLRANPDQPGLLEWEPRFADASTAGDLGYTTGPWEFTPPNAAEPAAWGQYASVWRKQDGGGWKVVIDIGVDHPRPAEGLSRGSGGVRAPDGPMAAPRATESAPDVGPGPGGETERTARLAAVRAELMDADVLLSRLAADMGAGVAVAELAGPDARLLQPGGFPFIGDAISEAPLLSRASDFVWEPQASRVADSADLGFTYGRYVAAGGDWQGAAGEGGVDTADGRPRRDEQGATDGQEGHYVHIWKLDAELGWRLVVAVFNPLPTPAGEVAGSSAR